MSALATPVSPHEKSTTVRPDYARVPGFVRTGFQVASRLAPPIAAAAAEHVFFRPHLRSNRVPHAARAERVAVGRHEIAAYVWGEGDAPAILLLHGWEGVAAQMAPLATALAADGHRVVAIDLPAHGQSTGNRTSLPAVARAVTALDAVLGPFRAVVGHSFGAVAAMVVARDLGLEKVVTIGGPATLRFVVESFSAAVGLDGSAPERFRARLERRFGSEIWQHLSPRNLATQIPSPALIVHDEDDGAVPFEQARVLASAWSGSSLFTTRGLGHYRVLRSADVIDAVRSFFHPGDSP